MLKVLMEKSEKGSPDGKCVKFYKAGREYMIPDSLYEVFVNVLKIAIPIEEEVEIKQVETTPENKMATQPGNKSTRKIDPPKNEKSVGKDKAKEFLKGVSGDDK